MRLTLLIALPGLAIAAPSPAGPGDTPVTVVLSNYSFAPSTIRLVHGHAYVLRLVNDSDRGHNFVAKPFFSAARVLVDNGAVEVPKHGAVDVHLVAPPPGRYKLRCTHFTHSMRGMTGEIIVE